MNYYKFNGLFLLLIRYYTIIILKIERINIINNDEKNIV